MKTKQFLLLGVATTAVCGCSSETATNNVAHFTEAEKDTTVSLADDFYQYSNGGWIAQHPLPADKARLGTFDILYEEGNDKLKLIVEEAQKASAPRGTSSQKIGDLYSLGMDTARRDTEGYTKIQTYLDLARAIDYSDSKAFAQNIATMHTIVSNAFFAFGRTPDFENSDMNIAELWQSGLGLPDRDYYFDESEHGKEIISAYKEMLSKLLASVGLDNTVARANQVFAFEQKIAEKMNTKVENRNPQNVCNKVSKDELASKVPGFDWQSYFSAMGVEPEVINLGQPKYFSQIFSVVKNADAEVLKDYFTCKTLASFSSDLTSDLYAISFDFYSKKLRGVDAMRPLWKRILSQVEGCLGDELGKLFVQKYFPASAKQRMQDLIEQLRISFGQRIENLTWMSDSTKVAAQEKLKAIRVKVGYPDKWKDYSALDIDPDKSYVENLIAVAEFEHKDEMAKIGQPVDKEEWFMTPQTVNAYYSPMNNEIVFPAGILQPPFFYAQGDDAVNYGAIGVVIGHEMTHGFDDQGSQFDKSGNLTNWWTAEDRDKFTKVTGALEERFSNLVVIDTLKGNGKLTLGENIADLGGLNIAHQAFRNTLEGKAEPELIDGQTAEQRFVYAYSRVWAGAIRDEAVYQQVMTDPHSTGRLRVNGQLPLLDFFYEAFNIKEGDAMYLPKEERIVIW